MKPRLLIPARPGELYVPLADGLFALIDEIDGVVVGRHSWRRQTKPGAMTSYVHGWVAGRTVQLHRFVWAAAGLPFAPVLDHVNGDGLDCRRSNLRPATPSQNRANSRPRQLASSQFKGVAWHRQMRKWQAQIRVDGKDRYLGLYSDERAAAEAYDRAALEAYGEFARPSSIDQAVSP